MPAAFNSPSRIITYAMMDAGLLQTGELPTSEQLTEFGDRLLDLINLWQTQGLKLWLQRDISVPLVATQSLYTVYPTGDVSMVKPMRIIQAYSLSALGLNLPIELVAREQFVRLPASTGTPNSLYVDKQRTYLGLNFWPTPDSAAVANTVHLVAQHQVTNFTSLTAAIEFPQEWFLALRWGLADDISTGQPESIMARCSARAESFRRALEDWDVEDASTFFQPDNRNNSRFH